MMSDRRARVLLEAVVFFSLCLGTTSLAALVPRVIRAPFWLSLFIVWGALALAALIASYVLGDPTAALYLSFVVVVVTLLFRAAQRRWSWVGTQLFSNVVLASLAYLVYAAWQTYARGLSAGVMAASTLLLLFE